MVGVGLEYVNGWTPPRSTMARPAVQDVAVPGLTGLFSPKGHPTTALAGPPAIHIRPAPDPEPTRTMVGRFIRGHGPANTTMQLLMPSSAASKDRHAQLLMTNELPAPPGFGRRHALPGVQHLLILRCWYTRLGLGETKGWVLE
jgi:hypothetical protein